MLHLGYIMLHANVVGYIRLHTTYCRLHHAMLHVVGYIMLHATPRLYHACNTGTGEPQAGHKYWLPPRSLQLVVVGSLLPWNSAWDIGVHGSTTASPGVVVKKTELEFKICY